MDNFYDVQEYSGNSKVFVGNGDQLPISHIGTVQLSTSNGVIPLKNTLCVLDIKRNLISIQALANDKNCHFNLYVNGFNIKENQRMGRWKFEELLRRSLSSTCKFEQPFQGKSGINLCLLTIGTSLLTINLCFNNHFKGSLA